MIRATSSIKKLMNRQTVKAVPPDAGVLEPSRDRHDRRDSGHLVMKAGVKAGDA